MSRPKSNDNSSVIKNLKKIMPKEEILYDLADFFKVFGDSTRIKIIYALSKSELCVHDISILLKMEQSAISHQLRILKQAKLVKQRREKKYIYYSLDDEHVEQIFNQAFDHINES